MKKLFFILTIAFFLTSCFTPQQVTFTEDDNFVKVYDNLNASKDELYLKANEWMIGTFNSAKSVIQHSDKEEGVIIGKYLMKSIVTGADMYGNTSTGDVFAIIDIRVKDNKARLEIKPNNYAYLDGMMNPYKKENAKADMEVLAADFSESIKSESVNF